MAACFLEASEGESPDKTGISRLHGSHTSDLHTFAVLCWVRVPLKASPTTAVKQRLGKQEGVLTTKIKMLVEGPKQ